jgi:hypothetical protein
MAKTMAYSGRCLDYIQSVIVVRLTSNHRTSVDLKYHRDSLDAGEKG